MILIKKANNPLVAVEFLLKGLKLLPNSRLRSLIIIPILINLVLYSIALILAYHYVDQLIAQFTPDWLHDFTGWLIDSIRGLVDSTSRLVDSTSGLFWLFAIVLHGFVSVLYWLAEILRLSFFVIFFIIFFVVSFFSFTILSNLIATQFYGSLAARTLSIISGEAQVVEQPLSQVIIAESKRAMYIIKRMLPLLILFVIPVVNIIAPIVFTLFSAWCLAMEFMAYPLENQGLLFVEQKALLKTARFGVLSFGGIVMLGLTLPVLNIIIGPAAVIGATIYLYELREKLEEPEEEISDEGSTPSLENS